MKEVMCSHELVLRLYNHHLLWEKKKVLIQQAHFKLRWFSRW